MKCSIVIVSWNTRELLDACLRSVYDHPPAATFEVWVVDNASHDGSAEMVHRRYPQVNLIASTQNLGFTGGNNAAIPHCLGELILLLNPDTEVKPGALQALIDFLDAHPQAGAAGSLLLNGDGTLQHSCYPVPTLGRELWRMFHLDRLRPYGVYDMDSWNQRQPRRVDVLMGAALMTRRAIFEQVGLLDEDYFIYSEEVDICYRMSKAGWSLHWVPQSRIIHYWGQSSKQIRPQMFLQLYRAKLHFFRKHYGRLSAFLYKTILAFAALLRLALTPLLIFSKGEARREKWTLARLYGSLLRTLPGM